MKKNILILVVSIFTPLIMHGIEVEPNALTGLGISKEELVSYINTVYAAKKSNAEYKENKSIPTEIDDMVNRLTSQALYFMSDNKVLKSPTPAKQSFTATGSSISYSNYLFASLDRFSQSALEQLRNSSKKTLDSQYDLTWCTCPNFTPQERIFFMLQLVLDIEKNNPNKQNELVYTSMASGGLLQDYLTITELIRAGYTNIRVNIIDLVYPDLTQIPSTHKERAEKLKILREKGQQKSELAGMIESTLRIENFQLHSATFLSSNASYKNTTVNIRNFTNEKSYITACQHNNTLKSNVLIMVDPDRPAIFKFKSPYPLITDVLQIKDDKNNDIYVILSPFQKPHFYSKSKLDESTQKRIDLFAGRTIDKHYYYDTSSIIGLLEERDNNLPFKLVATYASAHLAFQNVALNATKPGAIAYLAADVQVDADAGRRIKKVDINKLSSVDFIEETVGKDIKAAQAHLGLNCKVLTILK